MFLYVKAEYYAVCRFDKPLAEKLAKLFAETLVLQTYDNYFHMQGRRDQYAEAAFSVELEFSMLWIAKLVDASLLDKAKRIRELTLEALANFTVGGTEYVKALKSYLRGSKLKYAYVCSL